MKLSRFLLLTTGLVLGACTSFATDKTMADFTAETSPQSTDFVAGYRPPMQAGADRRFSLATLGTYFGTQFQPLNASNLSLLAALSGTNVLYYRDSSAHWSPVTVGTGLSFSAGTLSATAGAPAWSSITGTPTTRAGYGITDAAAATHTHALSDLTQSGATTNQVPQWSGTAWVPSTLSGGSGNATSIQGTAVSAGTPTLGATLAYNGSSYLAAAAFATTITGLHADGILLRDGVMTASSTTLTSASAAFVSGDVGKTITVEGAGAAGVPLVATIATRVSATSVTLAAAASTSVSAAYVAYGTDDSATINSAIAAFASAGGAVFIPSGTYFLSSSVLLKSGVSVYGVIPKTPAGNSSNKVWDNNATSSMANKGGTVFIGSTTLAAITAIDTTNDLMTTGCVVEGLGADGVGSLLKIGDATHVGTALCHFRDLVAVHTRDYALLVYNSHHCAFDFIRCQRVYGGLKWLGQHGAVSGGVGTDTTWVGTAGDSTFNECAFTQDPTGDNTPLLWFRAVTNQIAGIRAFHMNVNRESCGTGPSSGYGAACMLLDGTNQTSQGFISTCNFAACDFGGVCTYCVDCENASRVHFDIYGWEHFDTVSFPAWLKLRGSSVDIDSSQAPTYDYDAHSDCFAVGALGAPVGTSPGGYTLPGLYYYGGIYRFGDAGIRFDGINTQDTARTFISTGLYAGQYTYNYVDGASLMKFGADSNYNIYFWGPDVLGGARTPTGSNYQLLLGNATGPALNAPSGYEVGLRTNNVARVKVADNGLRTQNYGSGPFLPVPNVIGTHALAPAVTSGTAETDLDSFTISANTVSQQGASVVADWGGQASFYGSKTLRVYFGGNKIFDSGTMAADNSHYPSWSLHVVVARASTNTGLSTFAVTMTAYGMTGGQTVNCNQQSCNWGADQVLKVTGQIDTTGLNVSCDLGTLMSLPLPF